MGSSFGCHSRRRESRCETYYYEQNSRPVQCQPQSPIQKPKWDSDSFVLKNDLNLKHQKVREDLTSHYKRVITFDVDAGANVGFSYNGKNNGCNVIAGNHFMCEDSCGNYQKEADMFGNYRVLKVRKDGRDYYTIGVKHSFDGNIGIEANGKKYFTSTKEPLTETKNPYEEDPTQTVQKKEPPPKITPGADPFAQNGLEDLRKEAEAARLKAVELESKLEIETANAIHVKGTEIAEKFKSFIDSSPVLFGSQLKEIYNELLVGGTNKPNILDRAAIKLKVLAMQNPAIDQDKAKEMINALRDFATSMKGNHYQNETVTKFGVNESGKDYHYKVMDSNKRIRVLRSGGPISSDSVTQKKLNELFDEATKQGDWKTFDKGLEYAVEKGLEIYFEDK